VDRAVHPTSPALAPVGGVDDGVHALLSDVAVNDLDAAPRLRPRRVTAG
jgi:hypothetical protein